MQQLNSYIFNGIVKAQLDNTPGTAVDDVTDSFDCVMATLDDDSDSDDASLYAEPHVEIETRHKSPTVLTISLPSEPPVPQTVKSFTILTFHNDPAKPFVSSISTPSLPIAATSPVAVSVDIQGVQEGVQVIPNDLPADTGTSDTKA